MHEKKQIGISIPKIEMNQYSFKLLYRGIYCVTNTIYKVSIFPLLNQEWLMTGVGDRKANRVDKVDERLLCWLNEHPEIIRELKMRSGLD